MAQAGWDLLREIESNDDTLTLRRFMGFPKFQDLVNTTSLYLASASKFEDKLEGHYTFRDYGESDKQLKNWSLGSNEREIAKKAKATIARHNQGAVVISCWTMAPASHPRMWDEYAGSSEAVVIETTVGLLRKALGSEFLIIPVLYMDFDESNIPKEHSLQPFCYKQTNYAWEREVRVISEMVIGERIGTPRKVAIHLNTIISKVYLHAQAPKSFVDLVSDLAKKHIPAAKLEVVRDV